MDDKLMLLASEIRTLMLIISKFTMRDLEQRIERADVGLNAMQCGVMRLLRHHPYTISELSKHMLFSPATLVPVIDALEGEGLVRREQDPKDRRRTPLVVTPEGLQRLARVPAVEPGDAIYKALQAFGPARGEQLAVMLRALLVEMAGEEPAAHIIRQVRQSDTSSTHKPSDIV